MPGVPTLDHLVLFVPSSSLSTFTLPGLQVQSGGRHSDGLTENRLVVLPSGTYLEVIAFTAESTEEDQRKHPWGPALRGGAGWVDWALGGRPQGAQQEGYGQPRPGGRRTEDGKELEWVVTVPELAEKEKRGRRPFWCQDVTSREWRVPPLLRPHPNGASRISSLTLLTTQSSSERYRQTLSSILSSPPDALVLKSPYDHDEEGGKQVKVVVKAAQRPDEFEWIAKMGEGLFEVEIEVEGKHKNPNKVWGEEWGARIVFV